MDETLILVGEHEFKAIYNSTNLMEYFNRNFSTKQVGDEIPDLEIEFHDGYGKPFQNYIVEIQQSSLGTTYRRADYLIEVDLEYKKAVIHAHDELALKHALMNLYSAFIVHESWGLLVHSSCAIENSFAHLFAGESGAGKSTVARLSYPRHLLSDEASILKITPNRVEVFNSPFNSEIMTQEHRQASPLKSIQLLKQYTQNKRHKIEPSTAYMELMDKIFYWSYNQSETNKVFDLLKVLIHNVPVYNLHFKKSDTFWELIS
jgi:hypothetical protein